MQPDITAGELLAWIVLAVAFGIIVAALLFVEGVYGDPDSNLVYREPLDFHHIRRPIQNQAEVIGRVEGFGRHNVLFGYEYQRDKYRTEVTGGDDPDCLCGYWWLTIAPMNISTLEETQPPLDIETVARTTFVNEQIHALYWQDQIDVLPVEHRERGGHQQHLHHDRHDPGGTGRRRCPWPDQVDKYQCEERQHDRGHRDDDQVEHRERALDAAQVVDQRAPIREPVEHARDGCETRRDDPGDRHNALRANARQQRQILVVGIGAHRLAGARLLQEDEEQRELRRA